MPELTNNEKAWQDVKQAGSSIASAITHGVADLLSGFTDEELEDQSPSTLEPIPSLEECPKCGGEWDYAAVDVEGVVCTQEVQCINCCHLIEETYRLVSRYTLEEGELPTPEDTRG